FGEQLQILVNLGVIRPWYDRMIEVGKEWERQILRQLSSSRIILLLVSPSLCASKYAYGVEVQRAMALHRRGVDNSPSHHGSAVGADCLNVKSEERVVYKRLNSTGTLIQKTTMEAPHETLCITSDWMFTRRRSAIV